MADPFTLAALRSEIDADPVGLGYAGSVMAGDDAEIADLLNLARAGPTYLVYRGVINSYEIINATASSEWSALSSAEKQRYQTITGAGQVDGSNQNVRDAFAAMFAAGTATRTALLALTQRQGSRAEVLWGAGIVVNPSQVAAAFGRV